MYKKRQSISFFLASNCEFSSHHCTHLTRCTYFEHLYQLGADSVTVDNEVRKLFCGYDGYEIMVCTKLKFGFRMTPIISKKKMFSRSAVQCLDLAIHFQLIHSTPLLIQALQIAMGLFSAA